MNENIVCKPSPARTLAVSAAPIRELLNFLIYNQRRELLTEQARRQPVLSWEKIPSTAKALKEILGAEKFDKNGKLFFDCGNFENQVAVLLDNQGAQFWIHYFRCGVGLVSLSFFSHFASAEGSLTNKARSVMHSHEYQWFTHNLPAEFFDGEISEIKIENLGDYFIRQVNPMFVSPYSIYFENPRIKEPYKFISGSLEQLKEILTWTRFVCEGLKREKEPNCKTWVSPHMTINCGNLKDAPTFERVSETFINQIGALAVKENAPYTVLREGCGRRVGGYVEDWGRKNKHRIFLDLECEKREVPVREKIVARACLVSWLKRQQLEGARIVRTWKLES